MFLSVVNLKTNFYQIVSEDTESYNCIAWAKDENLKVPMWPFKGYYWPSDLPLIETLQNFINAFRKEGYEICTDGLFENGFEKLAIYQKESEPLHMARQMQDGQWTSKLGDLEDIVHSTCSELEGEFYGWVVQYLKRELLNN